MILLDQEEDLTLVLCLENDQMFHQKRKQMFKFFFLASFSYITGACYALGSLVDLG